MDKGRSPIPSGKANKQATLPGITSRISLIFVSLAIVTELKMSAIDKITGELYHKGSSTRARLYVVDFIFVLLL